MEVEDWSLTTLREKLIKIGAEIVSHGRCRMMFLRFAAPAAPFVTADLGRGEIPSADGHQSIDNSLSTFWFCPVS